MGHPVEFTSNAGNRCCLGAMRRNPGVVYGYRSSTGPLGELRTDRHRG
jgi:hypothetical protein